MSGVYKDNGMLERQYEIIGIPSGEIIMTNVEEFSTLNRMGYIKWGGKDIGFTFQDDDIFEMMETLRAELF